MQFLQALSDNATLRIAGIAVDRHALALRPRQNPAEKSTQVTRELPSTLLNACCHLRSYFSNHARFLACAESFFAVLDDRPTRAAHWIKVKNPNSPTAKRIAKSSGRRIVAGSPALMEETMSKTATTAIKFYVKENADGKPFLSLEFHGGLPNDALLLNEAHLYLNFRQRMSIDEAKDIARQMNENIESLSVMTPTL